LLASATDEPTVATTVDPPRALMRLASAFIAGSRSRIAASNGVAIKIDEYAPVARPIKSARDKSFNVYRTGSSRVVISSNVTARGIDIQQVSTVINFDIPKCVHTYLHRIGRSGRWGRKGVGINFVSRYDTHKIKEIEEHYRTQINELPLSIIESL
jgi:hypothetical protein